MDCRLVGIRQAKKIVDRLIVDGAAEDFNFRAFRFLQKKILTGQTLIQKNNFVMQHLALFDQGQPVFFVNLYRSRNPHWQPFQAVGFPLIVRGADLAMAKEKILSLLDPNLPCHMPLEAHINLGISFPAKQDSTSFLTVPYNYLQTRFFSLFETERTKTYHALKLTDPTVLTTRLSQVLAQVPKGFSFRPVSRARFGRDMTIYCHLVRRAMSGHALFYPLRLEEELELLQGLRWIFDPRFFQFLLHNEKEIGFIFAIPDFNEILDPTKSDFANALKLFLKKSQIRKGRIIYKGILPEYRGQGIFRYLRHQILNNFLKAGYLEIEGSYIDESNQASLGDAQSTFFTKSHTFEVKTLRLT